MTRLLFGANIAAVLSATLAVSVASAQPARQPDTLQLASDFSFEVLSPSQRDRAIRTISADIGFTRMAVPALGLSLGLGLTPTFATGHIFQLDESLQRVRLETSAVGLGPTVRARLQPLRWGRATLGIEASAGLIFYSRAFPTGGDHYDGMLRVGPILAVQRSASEQLRISAKWMHVSNGKGLGPHNPSYEAYGVTIGYTRQFTRTMASRAGVQRRSLIGAAVGTAVGAASGIALSRHCVGADCRIAPGISAVAALTGGGLGVALPFFVVSH